MLGSGVPCGYRCMGDGGRGQDCHGLSTRLWTAIGF